ncbi:MAG: EF-hand domain-containing protein [Xanthomonadaceae bacterium]|jgi:Ca2+-binding EF-hand superfamily protein|nr:EF-hand domain-containing protein [Xanthomonadaceae bacterium]
MNRKSLLIMAILAAIAAGGGVAVAQTHNDAPPPPMGAGHGGFGGPGGPGGGMRLDTDRDGRVSRAEAAVDTRLAERFDELDKNKDGFLDREDFTAQRREWRNQQFDAADTNKDGVLSREEYLASFDRRVEEGRGRFAERRRALFTRLDKNNDDKLSRDEIKDHPRLSQVFDQMDKNKDGFLQADEFNATGPGDRPDRRDGRGPRRGRGGPR